MQVQPSKSAKNGDWLNENLRQETVFIATTLVLHAPATHLTVSFAKLQDYSVLSARKNQLLLSF